MKVIFLAAMLLLAATFTFCQEKLTNITPPTSPAAYVLGAQPTAILLPKSYQALETALFSNFSSSEGKGIIPNDFGLEFTPYWATDHGLALEEYLFPKDPIVQFLRNSSFSVASSQNFTFEDKSPSNGLSFGYRTSFFIGGGKDREKIKEFTRALKSNQRFNTRMNTEIQNLNKVADITDASGFLDQIWPSIVSQIHQAYNIPATSEELSVLRKSLNDRLVKLKYERNSSDFRDGFYAILIEAINSIFKKNAVYEEFKKYISDRNGLIIDIAYGTFLNFPTNRFSYSIMPRQALWFTPTYGFKGSADFLKIIGVARYEWYDVDYYSKYFPSVNNFRDNWDVGAGVSAEFKKISLQMEGIYRTKISRINEGTSVQGSKLFSEKKETDFQCVGSVSYRINKQIALTYTLGDSFEQLINNNRTLVSLLSLNFGFGGPTKDNLIVSPE